MKERGIAVPPQKLKKEQDKVQRDRDENGGCFIHSRGMKPYPDPAEHPMRYQRRIMPVATQPTLFCPNCGGAGCGVTSVRIDEHHYCVDGMKLDRSQTWRLKHIHTISEDKEKTTATFLPAILMLHRSLNLDIANADVRKYAPSGPGSDGRPHAGAEGEQGVA